MRRPTGVTVIAVLLWLTGILNVFAGLGTMSDVSGPWGAVQALTGAAAIVFGVGCWQMRSWARIGTIVLMLLNAFGLVMLWVQYSDRIIVSRVVVPPAINAIVVLYLIQPKVIAAFKAAADPTTFTNRSETPA